jgi:hypothetical protein
MHFEMPREIWTNGSFLFFLLLIYTMRMPPHSTFYYFWLPARILHYIFSNVLICAVWVLTCVVGI